MKYEKYKVEYENRETHLCAFIRGETDSLEVSIDYFTNVISKCFELGFEKLLIAEEFDNQLSTMDMYRVGESVAKLLVQYPLKIAFIDKKMEHSELNKFGETVALNRGADVQIFQSIEDAESWLLVE